MELVVLADETGNAIGTADKAHIHTADTPLHFAFSAYVVNNKSQTLLSRRALTKLTWPGVWTNSFCGHPGPGESTADAVRRRAGEELGIEESSLLSVREVLPDFAYRAVDSSGIVEWELCPVFVVRIAQDAEVSPVPEEVDSIEWVDVDSLLTSVDLTPAVFSPWMVEELSHQLLRDALKA